MPNKETIRKSIYDAANTTRLGLKFNNKTDADILAKFASLTINRQRYIKDLIREDIRRNGIPETEEE